MLGVREHKGVRWIFTQPGRHPGRIGVMHFARLDQSRDEMRQNPMREGIKLGWRFNGVFVGWRRPAFRAAVGKGQLLHHAQEDGLPAKAGAVKRRDVNERRAAFQRGKKPSDQMGFAITRLR